MKILLVDDDLDEHFLFQEVISDGPLKSLQCEYASSVTRASEYLMREKPDLIILDLNMPGINGIEFLSTLRGNEVYKKVPVLVHTVSTNPEDLKAVQQLGADYFLEKLPVSEMSGEFSALLEAISTGDSLPHTSKIIRL